MLKIHMNIEVKYPVGYKFWVPRVYQRFSKETIQHPDKNGVLQEYSRDVFTLEVTAKQKIVYSIEIHITDSIKIQYWCSNVGHDFPMLVSECDMSFTEQHEALSYAQQHLEKTQDPYYGSSLD